MIIDRKSVYFVAGVGMMVGAFFAATKALSSLAGVIYLIVRVNTSGLDLNTERIRNLVETSQVASIVSGLVTFLILCFGARWMIRGPKMLEKWSGVKKEESGE